MYSDCHKGSGTFGSLLHLCVDKLQAEHVDVLLSNWISPNIIENLQKDTPLHNLVQVFNKQPAEAINIMQ